MADDTKKRDSADIVTAGNQALAQRSAALVSRGLREISSRDPAIFAELGKALVSSLQLDQVLRVIMEKMQEFLRPQTWYLLILDESEEELHFELAVGKDSEKLNDVRIDVGRGIAGWVAKNCEAVVAADARKDSRFLQEVDGWPGTETRSIVAVPVRFRDKCLGVIGLVNFCGPEGFPQADLSLLHAFADFAAIALENARHVKSIHDLTITDDQTGLYNARHLGFILDTEVYRSQRYGYEFSLLFVDLDSLKDLKESLSYAHFTRLLNELGQRFKDKSRLIDFAFYYGEGEFVLILPQTSKEGGRFIARSLHKLFKETSWLQAEGQNVRLPAKVAVGAFPNDGKTKVDLLHAIDEVMYLLKKSSADGVAAANSGILSSL
jgi:diguanylate cyclase (GGDEF)-like protein